jgi:oligopeptide/dipeptide ABC transporter ATP-binding protein
VSALLELHDLRVEYAARGGGPALRAVDGVSLELERGASLGLVGESGCGKSTLARALLGLEPIHGGSLRFDGVELAGAPAGAWRELRRRVAWVPQDPFSSLDPRLCVRELVCEPLDVHGVGARRERPARAVQALEAVGLRSHMLERYPHEFSGGQRQRIALARALALEPEVLVLDEPTSALDVSVRVGIVELLAHLRARFDLAFLLITHDLAVARLLCERVAVMYLGRLVEEDAREALFAAPAHPYTRALLACAPPPDPRLAVRRAPLSGEVPPSGELPAGCRYHPRCAERTSLADGRCERDEPPLRARGATGRTACHLHDPRATRA